MPPPYGSFHCWSHSCSSVCTQLMSVSVYDIFPPTTVSSPEHRPHKPVLPSWVATRDSLEPESLLEVSSGMTW